MFIKLCIISKLRISNNDNKKLSTKCSYYYKKLKYSQTYCSLTAYFANAKKKTNE